MHMSLAPVCYLRLLTGSNSDPTLLPGPSTGPPTHRPSSSLFSETGSSVQCPSPTILPDSFPSLSPTAGLGTISSFQGLYPSALPVISVSPPVWRCMLCHHMEAASLTSLHRISHGLGVVGNQSVTTPPT